MPEEIQTAVTRLLDDRAVNYRVLPHSEPVFTVEEAARQRGVDPREMVKSILLRDGAGRYVMACLPGPARLDPKAVRAQLPPQWKRLRFATADEIAAVTGYVQGAVNPLGLPSEVPVIFDQQIARLERVNISSGHPLAGLELASADLIRLSGARLAAIAQEG